MIVFIVIGLLLSSVVLLKVALVGIACIGYNPRDSKSQGLGGLVLLIIGIGGIWYIWHKWSPFAVSIVGALQ